MTDAEDLRYMRLALMLGRRGMGQVWPNPSVGCVIVKDGRIVGRGSTVPGGRPHAEVVALTQAGEHARGSTVYVSLEPCAHTGRTPPCAQALVAAQVARVVISCDDPDPRVDGRGVAMLQAAGVSVVSGVLAAEAAVDHAGFFKRVREGRPFVTLKLATTLDGKIATQTGESQWITGPDARRAVHAMRARHDAVIVGAGTVRADDPQLTVRDMGPRRQPVRIVVSRDLDLPADAQLFAPASDAPVWLCHGPEAATIPFTDQGAVAVPCALSGDHVDLSDMAAQLGARGLTRVFCEGGGRLAASLLKADLVDRLELFHAGRIIGNDGTAAIGDMGIDALADAARFALAAQVRMGPDVLTSWDRVPA